MIDKFYPQSDSMEACATGKCVGVVGLVQRLQTHLDAAKTGSMDAERRLISRIGQVRRHVPVYSKIDAQVQVCLALAIEYLRSVGRKVNLGSDDPAMWISQRNGQPRW